MVIARFPADTIAAGRMRQATATQGGTAHQAAADFRLGHTPGRSATPAARLLSDDDHIA